MQVTILVSNHQLEVGGVTAAHTLLMREATKLAEQRKQQAGNRIGPKF